MDSGREQATKGLSSATRRDQGKEGKYIGRVSETAASALSVRSSPAEINDEIGEANGAGYSEIEETSDFGGQATSTAPDRKPRRKRGHEGLFCSESEDEEPAAGQPPVSGTKKAKLEVAEKDVYESSYSGVNDNGRGEATTIEDMTKALVGVQESPKARKSLEQTTEYEYCGFLIAPRHSDEEISQAFVAHEAFRRTLSPETRAKTPYRIIMPPKRPLDRPPVRSVVPPPEPCPADLRGITPAKGIFDKIRAKRLMKKHGDSS